MTDDRSGRTRRTAPALGVPVGFPDQPDRHEVTDPLDLWTRSVYTDAERRVIDALGMDPHGPVPLGQLVKVVVGLAEEKHRRLKSDTDRQHAQYMLADQIMAMNQAISPDHAAEMDRRLEAVEKDLDEQKTVTGRTERHIESLLASRKFWRWVAGLGIPGLLSAAFAILLYSVDKIASSSERVGATTAKIEDLERLINTDKIGLERLIDKLDQDIRELRKHAGLDKPVTDGRIGINP